VIEAGLRALFEAGRTRSPFKARRLFRDSEAAELLEFALALPLILVMLVGILDFASAYHLKQELANAAREGARLGSSESRLDTSTAAPASVQAIKDDVTTYLQNAGVNTAFIGSTMAYSTSTLTATYYSTGTYGLMIERNYQIYDSSGNPIFANRVTLTYPYNWTYGFNHIIKLLVPSSNIGGTITITAVAAMPQLGP
jgi:Flp pilus assembly protein TadG